jgi:L-aminopeptidase/D-esterase-like protein
MKQGVLRRSFGGSPERLTSTTLAVVATDAGFDRQAVTKIAALAQNGLARALSPVHTTFDGDVVFSLSLGRKEADLNTVGTVAAEVVAEAIVRGVKRARGLGGVPALKELAGKD